MDSELMRIISQIVGVGGIAIGDLLFICCDAIRKGKTGSMRENKNAVRQPPGKCLAMPLAGSPGICRFRG